MEPKQTVQAFVDAINSQDWARLDLLVAPDFVRHSIAAGESRVRSRADLVDFLRHGACFDIQVKQGGQSSGVGHDEPTHKLSEPAINRRPGSWSQAFARTTAIAKPS